jgi:hypothetical protein
MADDLELTAIDRPSDNGRAVMVTWRRAPNEGLNVYYELMMSDKPDGPFWPQGKRASVKPKEGEVVLAMPCPLKSDFPAAFGFADKNAQYHALEVGRFRHEPSPGAGFVKDKLVRDQPYYFRLHVIRDNVPAVVGAGKVVEAIPVSNWFAGHKTNLLIAMFVLSAIIMAYARIAKRDPSKLFIRRIAGLEAVDEALGRAAEMGKPVFFSHGPGGLTEVVTISALNMLGKISERVAEFGIEMKVTCLNYLVMQVSQEMVRDGYTRVGRPDAYKDDNVFFVSQSTFAYSAAVSGMMIRENAGTAFFFGRFGSESLLLAETGAITKAIQIAGTDSFNQIAFFITTCDYTLIGEEMYAASAYLSREPRLVGAVKGQDVVKAIFMILIVTGAALASFGLMGFARIFWPLTN